MAELPTGQNGEPAETHKALLTPFLTKTYQLVDDSEVDDVISWNQDGTGFIILKPAEFARDLLPKYFKHNNLSSFVRQLNTYGFRKAVPDRWEFANDFFKRGEKGLLHDIQRRKVSQLGSVPSTAATAEGPSTAPVTDSSPRKLDEREEPAVFLSQGQGTDSATPAGLEEKKGGTNEGSSSKSKSTSPELRKENRRLEEENQQMTDELSHLKGLCGDIFSMMSNYGPSSGQQDHGNVSMESRQLELLQSGNCLEEQGGSSGGNAGAMDDKEEAKKEEEDNNNNNNHMLFGVSIGAKRRKLNNEDESSDKQQQQQQQQHDGTESYSYSNTAHSEKKKETGL